MNRLFFWFLCLGTLCLTAAGCSESKPKDYIPTEIQAAPTEPPIMVGGPPRTENPSKPAAPPPKERPKAVSQ